MDAVADINKDEFNYFEPRHVTSEKWRWDKVASHEPWEINESKLGHEKTQTNAFAIPTATREWEHARRFRDAVELERFRREMDAECEER